MSPEATLRAYRHAGLRPALAVFCVLAGVEFAAIMLLNSGFFVFTLDDPYIHLALSENILHGHYGVNSSEFSAPSSSILWPFLLAPFAGLESAPYLLLALNLLVAAVTLWALSAALGQVFTAWSGQVAAGRVLLLLLWLTVAVNLVGLVFTGMEHSAQLLAVALLMLGLIREAEQGRLPAWLLPVIVIAPLVRYECMALSAPALLYLFLRGYRAQAVAYGLLLALLLGAFAGFLVSLGLDAFPTSVISKSSVVATGAGLGSLVGHLKTSLTGVRGMLLIVSMLLLLYPVLDRRRHDGERLLALAIAGAISLHLLAGNYDMYNRYEMYIVLAAHLALLYLYRETVGRVFDRLGLYRAAGLLSLALVLLYWSSFNTLLSTPVAANNIYQQQYQMHRFATDYYAGPVAVNDLGYVAYRNRDYVLDLWGLASIEALLQRRGGDEDWLDRITRDRQVRVAMIYEDWFGNIPAHWQLIGRLRLGRNKITPASREVAFFAVDCDTFIEVQDATDAFERSLPEGVEFHRPESRCGGPRRVPGVSGGPHRSEGARS